VVEVEAEVEVGVVGEVEVVVGEVEDVVGVEVEVGGVVEVGVDVVVGFKVNVSLTAGRQTKTWWCLFATQQRRRYDGVYGV